MDSLRHKRSAAGTCWDPEIAVVPPCLDSNTYSVCVVKQAEFHVLVSCRLGVRRSVANPLTRIRAAISFNHMVERASRLDAVFGSLSDPTRRDILKRVSRKSMTVGEIATHYPLTFAAVAKHLDVLHRARLISKERRGREQLVSITPDTLLAANRHLETYKQLWENRLDSLDRYLKTINKNDNGRK